MAGTQAPIAVLGIGAMGHGLATSALRAGVPTIVWDRRAEASRDLAGLGAEVADTAADAASRAAIAVTMATDADAVISIAVDHGMLAALARGAIWVATLFDALGQRTIWVGPVGAGTRLKLVNNTWLAFATEAIAASVALARRLGLETRTVVEALGGAPVVSPWQAAKLQRIADVELSAQFALSLALKDVRLSLEAAGDDRFAALACLADEWQQVLDQGLGCHDLTVVTKALEQQGSEPGPGAAAT